RFLPLIDEGTHRTSRHIDQCKTHMPIGTSGDRVGDRGPVLRGIGYDGEHGIGYSAIAEGWEIDGRYHAIAQHADALARTEPDTIGAVERDRIKISLGHIGIIPVVCGPRRAI